MFEWDETKRIVNLQKHGVDFADAAQIFDGPVLEVIDDRNDYGETRFRAIGEVDDDRFVVVYTWRKEKRRIISAWKVGSDDTGRYS